jgi:hypothetical protein
LAGRRGLINTLFGFKSLEIMSSSVDRSRRHTRYILARRVMSVVLTVKLHVLSLVLFLPLQIVRRVGFVPLSSLQVVALDICALSSLPRHELSHFVFRITLGRRLRLTSCVIML